MLQHQLRGFSLEIGRVAVFAKKRGGYAYLFRQLADETEAGLEIRSLIKTKVPKIEYHRYAARTDAHFRRFFQIVRLYLDDLDRGDFAYRPGFGCTMCEFRDGPCITALA